jgi:thiol-disulfide isomerase/thioredoxin
MQAAFLMSIMIVAAATAQIAATDVAGQPVQLFGAGSSKPVVLIFVRTDCPISNRYAPEIERLYLAYAQQVAFYAVYPDSQESAEAIQKHRSEYKFTVPVLRDPSHALVKLAEAQVTPEAAVFSARGELIYHGRIDNRYVSVGKAMNRATRADMENALQAVLAGRPVKQAVTRAIGCSLADAN